jgi:hypothetical protein
MVKENFGDFFNKLSLKSFKFLIDEYNFEFLETQTPGFGAFSTFINTTTRIEVWWDIRDNYINVLIVPIKSENDSDARIKEKFYLDDILRLRAPNLKLEHKIPGDILEEKYMETALMQFSAALKEYGKDILKGDFSILKP